MIIMQSFKKICCTNVLLFIYLINYTEIMFFTLSCVTVG